MKVETVSSTMQIETKQNGSKRNEEVDNSDKDFHNPPKQSPVKSDTQVK